MRCLEAGRRNAIYCFAIYTRIHNVVWACVQNCFVQAATRLQFAKLKLRQATHCGKPALSNIAWREGSRKMEVAPFREVQLQRS